MTSFGWDFPSVSELTELHGIAIAEFGGAASPPKEGCVDRSIASAINASLYSSDDDSEPDLLLAAAHLLFYVAKNHCFTDGNKRAAWSAVVRALDINGIWIEADANQESAADLVIGVASGARTVRDILLWFYEPGRLRARPEAKEQTP
jgi:death-on-curing protein